MSTTQRILGTTVKRRIAAAATLCVAALAVGLLMAPNAISSSSSPYPTTAYIPKIGHVFVINIENKGYATTWGPGSAAPYLAQTLRSQGVLLNSYYGTAHNSEPNYIAEVSGQGPNPQMQGDCQIYSDFAQAGTAAPGQAVGSGCVFPASTPSLMSQMDAAKLSWRGYMDDMAGPCVHPTLNGQDGTQTATATNEYATRHDPFMYFHSVIDNPTYCAQHVVPLTQLDADLQSASTTPNLTFITPDLCNDGHDAPCANGQPGGLKSVDAWMKVEVPKILNSPAFQKDGMLVITADESDSPQSDATACCGEGAGPNSPLPGIVGSGGGVIGALVLSKWTSGGTWSTTPYNHYALLATLEEIFGLPKIGYAQTPGLDRFGLDVFNSGWQRPSNGTTSPSPSPSPVLPVPSVPSVP
ncbi:MAG: phosphatidylinositol-3-phosphatase [Marmoricola sp.]